MSNSRRHDPNPPNATRKPPSAYEGDDQYIEWIHDYLDVALTPEQKGICRAVARHNRVLVMGANAFGKSYGLSGLALAFLFSNFPASTLATSGTYKKLRRTLCDPIEQLHGDCWGLPGEYKRAPPRIDIEQKPEIGFEAAAPTDAGELEGAHNTYTLGIIEEADKDRVDADVVDSMESLMTDARDRLVVSANPPKDETNVVADLMDDPTWEVLQFSSFDSWNVQVELGNADGTLVDGLATLGKIQDDWESWNAEPWPGVEAARESHARTDLDERWYRRRLGVMPPETAGAHRPFTVQDVEAAVERVGNADLTVTATPDGLALDVARMGGDRNALGDVSGQQLDILDTWTGSNHVENEERVLSTMERPWQAPLAVDAVGEGSGLYDRLDQQYTPVVRFQAGAKASSTRRKQFRDKWAEGMHLLGQFIKEGGAIADDRLAKELKAAARSVEYTEKYLASRSSEVLELTPKSDIKARLGRSPDLLDAAMMAVYVADPETEPQSRTVPSTWNP